MSETVKMGMDFIMVEVLLKLTALEKLLVRQGVIKTEDFVSEIKAISEQIQTAAKTAATKTTPDIDNGTKEIDDEETSK